MKKENKMDLREWQDKAMNYFKLHPNCLVQCATGSGKSFFAIQCIKYLLSIKPEIKTLVVAPKNVILEQTWLDELHKLGFPINRVGIYNQSAKEFSQITLCSIQSLHNVVESGLYNYFEFVIFDEVHNYGTSNYLKLLKIPKKYKIGLTATLEREDMNEIKIKSIFNFKIFNYGIEQSIKDGILNKFDFTCIRLKLSPLEKLKYELISQNINMIIKMNGTGKISHIKDEAQRNKLLKLINERKELVDKNEQKRETAIKVIKKYKNNKIIVFNQYNVISKNLYWDLIDNNITSNIVNSDISKFQQVRAFTDFENDKNNVLLTTTMTDEGYNLPKIDVAIIMSQNSTNKQFIQRIGRVLRKKEHNSKIFYLIIEDTYEETNYIKRKEFIKRISDSFEEVKV